MKKDIIYKLLCSSNKEDTIIGCILLFQRRDYMKLLWSWEVNRSAKETEKRPFVILKPKERFDYRNDYYFRYSKRRILYVNPGVDFTICFQIYNEQTEIIEL